MPVEPASFTLERLEDVLHILEEDKDPALGFPKAQLTAFVESIRERDPLLGDMENEAWAFAELHPKIKHAFFASLYGHGAKACLVGLEKLHELAKARALTSEELARIRSLEQLRERFQTSRNKHLVHLERKGDAAGDAARFYQPGTDE